MDNVLEPELAKIVGAVQGGDGGFNSKPVVLPSGGLALKLTASSLIRDYLKAKIDEINNAEGDEQQRLIDSLPPKLKSILLESRSNQSLGREA